MGRSPRASPHPPHGARTCPTVGRRIARAERTSDADQDSRRPPFRLRHIAGQEVAVQPPAATSPATTCRQPSPLRFQPLPPLRFQPLPPASSPLRPPQIETFNIQNLIECKEKANQVVLPVFYDVDPFEVHDQTGGFGVALALHQQRFGTEKVSQWKTILTKVANFSGWDLRNIADRYL
nr:TMV resistance protein N-like [Ipomoea batatas]